MRVTVNGEAQDFPPGATVTAALDQLGINGRGVAVELNREIVPKSQHPHQQLKDGDAIEIVQFVGGG
jgi:sulfur carrier protein